jgi:hypothetical protein
MVVVKEIVERRHGEPIKFLFLPKMGLLGGQASKKMLVVSSEQLFRAVFHVFMGKNLIFNIFFYIVKTLKSCLIQKYFFFFNLGRFKKIKNRFF